MKIYFGTLKHMYLYRWYGLFKNVIIQYCFWSIKNIQLKQK